MKINKLGFTQLDKLSTRRSFSSYQLMTNQNLKQINRFLSFTAFHELFEENFLSCIINWTGIDQGSQLGYVCTTDIQLHGRQPF